MDTPSYTFKLPTSVMVTGATGAIGSALCRTLSHNGVQVIAVARSADKLSLLADELESINALAHESLVVDFSSRHSIAAFSSALESIDADIDGLVLNPPRIAPNSQCFPGMCEWDAVFQQTFLGPLQLMEAAVSRIRNTKSENKRIAIISGISSKQVLSHYSLNNVIRSAWAAQAKTLAFALGEHKIHVNTLSIGGLLTPAYTQRIEAKAKAAGLSFDEQMERETENVPLKKYASIDETVEALIGLLSGFTGHMTGVNFPFEGGYFPQY